MEWCLSAFLSAMSEPGIPLNLAPPAEATAPPEAAASFEVFFLDARPRLLGAMTLTTGDRYAAEEIVQEAFFRVWQRWDRVGVMSDPVGYLYRTAMNTHRSTYRRTVRAAKRIVVRPPEDDPFVRVAAADAVLRALVAMTPRQRAVIVLMELQGYDAAEVASMLGIKPGTVHVLASKARAAIRQMETDDE